MKTMQLLHRCTFILAAAVLCTSLLTIAREQFGNEASVTTHLKNVTTLTATKAGKTSKAGKPEKNTKDEKSTSAVPSGAPHPSPSLSSTVPSDVPLVCVGEDACDNANNNTIGDGGCVGEAACKIPITISLEIKAALAKRLASMPGTITLEINLR